MKVLAVVGNRPQFIKAAAVSGLLRKQHEEILVHTGQHYDDSLSRVFFAELGLARPDRELGLGGGTNTAQTARMLAALGPLLDELRPDAALVYGDTNSTLAGALAAGQAHIPLVHIEAGMRSHDRTMPEELNRVVTDHLSDLLLCASETATQNLRAEAIAGRAVLVGDVMIDVAARRARHARRDVHAVRARGLEPGEDLLLTAHRPGNVDAPERLGGLRAHDLHPARRREHEHAARLREPARELGPVLRVADADRTPELRLLQHSRLHLVRERLRVVRRHAHERLVPSEHLDDGGEGAERLHHAAR